MNKKTLVLTALLTLMCVMGNAAPFKNIERIVVQPNGDTLHCYASGDEFYNRLHDAKGFTIIQDEKTGYFVYASQNAKGDLTATTLIAGMADPEAEGLAPNLMISQETYLQRRHEMEQHIKPVAVPKDRDLNQGNYNNLIVYIRFSGDDELGTTASEIDSMFNGCRYNDVSMYNYFHHASYNKLNLHSYSFPQPDGEQLLSYEDIYPREYYMPYNAATNPLGYQDWEHTEREFSLLERACRYVDGMIPDTLDLDYNLDGNIDNVVFVVKGNVTDWATLLWPHRWVLYDREVYLNDKRVWDFNFQLETSSYFSTSTLCHEMFHSLGAPDLYHYNYALSPVGSWDLMCANAQPPQHSGIYMKHKYGNWVDDIPEITEYGTYELEADSWEGCRRNAYKIQSSNPSQFYILEYRDNRRLFETGIPGGGILIYRIDTRFSGCAGYDGVTEFDEVYIFRPGGSQTADGSINAANFNNEYGRNAFNATTDPYPFFTGGTVDEAFNICNISEMGDRMSFTYCPRNNAVIPENLIANVVKDEAVKLSWDAIPVATAYNIYRDGIQIATGVSENSYDDEYATLPQGYHQYQVTSVCDGQESFRSATKGIISGEYCKIDFAMNDTGNNGWEGGEIMASFDNNQEPRYFTIYAGSERTESIIVPKGTIVTLDWLTGWEDSECQFVVSYDGGQEIYASSVLSAGELISFTSDSDTQPCISPENLACHVEGTRVVLNWTSPVETEQYEVFRDGEALALVSGQTYTDETVTHSGTHFYKVRAKSSDCSSDFSDEVYATVMDYFCGEPRNLSVIEGENEVVNLNWEHDFGGLLCYDNGVYEASIGSNSMVWGIRILPEQLAMFAGTRLTKIEMFDASAGNYTFKVYNGAVVNDANLLCVEQYAMTASHEFAQVPLSEPITFDATLPIWVTVKSNGASNPGPCCTYVGNPNGCLMKSGSVWTPITSFGMHYSWLLRLYTTFQDDNSVKYNIYRNGDMLVNDYESTNYADQIVASNEYCYKVAVVYNGEETAFTDESCVSVMMDVEGHQETSLELYPNPVSDVLSVKCDGMKTVKLMNAAGTVVLCQNVEDGNALMNLSTLPSGIYAICIVTESEVITKAISVVR